MDGGVGLIVHSARLKMFDSLIFRIDVELAEEYKGTRWELSGHLALLISPIGLLQTRGIRHLSLHRGVLLQVGHLYITLGN